MRYGRHDPSQPRGQRRFRHPAEARGLAFLEARGHLLLRHNFHLRFGEIDLITSDPGDAFRLHAVEVKAWRSTASAEPFVHPLETLNARKRAKMRRVMQAFRLQADRVVSFSVASERAVNSQAAGRDRPPPQIVDEPAWILAGAGCPVSIMDLDVSFDLLWIRGPAPDDCEYFPDLF